MYYLSRGPMMWVTPLSAFATPVPQTATYYTVPQYYIPPAMPVDPMMYGPPAFYGAPVAYAPPYYGQFPECSHCAQAPAPSLPRGEYRCGRCLLIC